MVMNAALISWLLHTETAIASAWGSDPLSLQAIICAPLKLQFRVTNVAQCIALNGVLHHKVTM